MIVGDFLAWAQSASAAQRAEGASALARAYLHSELDPASRREAGIALTLLADDLSPRVRRALADALASARQAPRPLIAALANDQSDVAAPILSRSPLLSEAELLDCATIGDALAQTAIARRAHVPVGVAAALADFGAREAAITLAMNPGADLTEAAMRRLLERFGDDGEIREALLARPSLPGAVRSQLVEATASTLLAFTVDCVWLSPERAERLSREARDKANVTIAAQTASASGRKALRAFVSHLRRSGQLTASLILRALLSGRRDLFEAALVELSGLSEARVAGQLGELKGAGFAALYAKAGLPSKFLPAFRAALEALGEPGAARGDAEAELRLAAIEHVLARCDAVNGGDLDRLLTLLRRFEMEAALEAARAKAPALAARDAPRRLPAPIVDMRALEEAIDHAAFRRNRLNAGNVIDSKTFERALREKPASTFSGRTRAEAA
jgi:uncharacterized protein (DUF2336 family)